MSKPDRLKLGVLLRQAHSKAAAALNIALEPLSLTGKHFGVLLHLSRRGESTHKELLTLMGSDKASMARTIDALVDAGLVSREVSPTDRRVNRLTLTEAGYTITQDALTRAATVGRDLFHPFSEPELLQLTELLERFVDSSTSQRTTDPPR